MSKARQAIEAKRVYGRVSVLQVSTFQRLPYSTNLVNLLIADDDVLKKQSCPQDEVMRVLAPGGVAMIRRDGKWHRTVKPVPTATDEWTHHRHGPDGNLLSQDRVVGTPTGIQWLAGPMFPQGGRKSSMHSFVSSGGRVFSLTQNELSNLRGDHGRYRNPNFLVARDAYNGLFLWKRRWRGPTANRRSIAGRGATSARMVAIRDTVYLVDENGIAAINARTGKERFRFETNEVAQQILVANGVLLAESSQALTAFTLATGKKKWTSPVQGAFGTVLSKQRVHFIAGKRDKRGDKINELICLDLAQGNEQWRHKLDYASPVPAYGNMLSICFVTERYLGLMDDGAFQMLTASEGKPLWTTKSRAEAEKSFAGHHVVAHFFVNGLVWHRTGAATWQGLDPQTGSVKRTLKGTGAWPRTGAPGKMGCQPIIATPRFLLVPRQATLLPFDSGKKESFKFMRGACGLGAVPANGLLYSFPHACGCYSESLFGFVALKSESGAREKGPNPRLVKGPAFGIQLAKDKASAEDWPTFRHDPQRSAAVDTTVPPKLQLLWSTKITDAVAARTQEEWELRTLGPVTAPVIAGDRCYVGYPESHRVVALDVKSGRELWRQTLNGRMATPPTIYRGLCLIGCNDGWVYCLSASTGKLVWRFRAAPTSRQIIAYGQVESPWPIKGGVLVRDGLAFVAAGRAPDGDGGVWIHALKPTTGEVVWSKNVTDGQWGNCDVLVSNDKSLYLLGKVINPTTGTVTSANMIPSGKPGNSSFLRGGKSGLIDAFWTRQALALRKGIQTWTYRGIMGQMLAFDEETTCGYDALLGLLFAQGKPEWKHPVAKRPQVEALVLTKQTLFAGGPADRYRRAEQGGIVWCLSRKNGKSVLTIPLKAPPVHDGMAVARGQLFVVTEDGHVSCYGSSR
ncbi:MAG: outer membrane protein assembly factor BamB family protein [Alphaproteobacteria bacterium]